MALQIQPSLWRQGLQRRSHLESEVATLKNILVNRMKDEEDEEERPASPMHV